MLLEERDLPTPTMEEKILLEQEVSQGDILSSNISNLCAEILLLKITRTDHLEGVTFAKVEARCEAYADDMAIVIKRTEQNLMNLRRPTSNPLDLLKLEKYFLKVESLIIKWERRNLATSGRVPIAKAILLTSSRTSSGERPTGNGFLQKP